MRASAWKNGGETYGIRVTHADRNAYFRPEWTEIHVEIDREWHRFPVTPSFWRKCSEFRDQGRVIRDWLQRQFGLPWARGNPPQVELTPLGDNRFRLSAS
jgi:hypothetical protein